MNHSAPFALGRIAAATVVAALTLAASMLALAALLAPSEVHTVAQALMTSSPLVVAVLVAYFTVALWVARQSSRDRSVLQIGAVATGAVFSLWFSVGLGYGTTPAEMWGSGLLGSVVLSSALLLGSALLHEAGAARRGPSTGDAVARR